MDPTVKYVRVKYEDTQQLSEPLMFEVISDNVFFPDENISLTDKMKTKAEKEIYADTHISLGRISNDKVGKYSVVLGNNEAFADYTLAAGYGTLASGENQTVVGKFNIEDIDNKYAFIVGNGHEVLNDNAEVIGEERSDAFRVAWDGTTQIDKLQDMEGNDIKPSLKNIIINDTTFETGNGILKLIAGDNITLQTLEVEDENQNYISVKISSTGGGGGGGGGEGDYLPLKGGTLVGPLVIDRTEFESYSDTPLIIQDTSYELNFINNSINASSLLGSTNLLVLQNENSGIVRLGSVANGLYYFASKKALGTISNIQKYGSLSLSYGDNLDNYGGHSLMFGSSNLNYGNYGIIFGENNLNNNDYSAVLGYNNYNYGNYSLIYGKGTSLYVDNEEATNKEIYELWLESHFSLNKGEMNIILGENNFNNSINSNISGTANVIFDATYINMNGNNNYIDNCDVIQITGHDNEIIDSTNSLLNVNNSCFMGAHSTFSGRDIAGLFFNSIIYGSDIKIASYEFRSYINSNKNKEEYKDYTFKDFTRDYIFKNRSYSSMKEYYATGGGTYTTKDAIILGHNIEYYEYCRSGSFDYSTSTKTYPLFIGTNLTISASDMYMYTFDNIVIGRDTKILPSGKSSYAQIFKNTFIGANNIAIGGSGYKLAIGENNYFERDYHFSGQDVIKWYAMTIGRNNTVKAEEYYRILGNYNYVEFKWGDSEYVGRWGREKGYEYGLTVIGVKNTIINGTLDTGSWEGMANKPLEQIGGTILGSQNVCYLELTGSSLISGTGNQLIRPNPGNLGNTGFSGGSIIGSMNTILDHWDSSSVGEAYNIHVKGCYNTIQAYKGTGSSASSSLGIWHYNHYSIDGNNNKVNLLDRYSDGDPYTDYGSVYIFGNGNQTNRYANYMDTYNGGIWLYGNKNIGPYIEEGYLFLYGHNNSLYNLTVTTAINSSNNSPKGISFLAGSLNVFANSVTCEDDIMFISNCVLYQGDKGGIRKNFIYGFDNQYIGSLTHSFLYGNSSIFNTGIYNTYAFCNNSNVTCISDSVVFAHSNSSIKNTYYTLSYLYQSSVESANRVFALLYQSSINTSNHSIINLSQSSGENINDSLALGVYSSMTNISGSIISSIRGTITSLSSTLLIGFENRVENVSYSLLNGINNTIINTTNSTINGNNINTQDLSYGIAYGIGHNITGTHKIVLGQYSKDDENDRYLFIYGNGEDEENRSNLITIDKNGVLNIKEIYAEAYYNSSGEEIGASGENVPIGTVIINQNPNSSGYKQGFWSCLGKKTEELEISDGNTVSIELYYWKRLENEQEVIPGETYSITGIAPDDRYFIIGTEIEEGDTFSIKNSY